MPAPLGERVKIIATIGPASSAPDVLASMLREGVDAVRLNGSHVDPPDVGRWVRRVRRAARAAGRDIAIMLDLPGIKLRIGDLPEPLVLDPGGSVVLSPRRGPGRVPARLGRVVTRLRPGSDVFLHDGFLRLRVRAVRAGEVHCDVVRGGLLTSRAGVNVPGTPVDARIPTPRDRQQLRAGVAAGVDIFALSFVRAADEVRRCRRLAGGVPLVAKIERPEAVAAVEEIAAASDAVLVARGDLAVEMRPEELPVLQKSLVATANRLRTPVIVATEMLASMVDSPRPTRAELTDVGNAVLDGADAALLTEETAMGRDPANVVRTMARILASVENSLARQGLARPPAPDPGARPDWAVADAAVTVARQVGASAIVAITSSGRTARLISAGRPHVPIFSFATDPAVARRIALMWGVYASTVRAVRDPERLMAMLLEKLRSEGRVGRGDLVVLVYGAPPWGEQTRTDTVRVARVR